MLKLFWGILLDQRGDTLSMTRKTAGTVITSAGFNLNWDEIEAVVNALTSTNLAADSVTNTQIASSVVRTDYGLSQHTDGTLQVDPSDTNPCLEITDGGVRAKVAETINRTSGGLTWGRSGDVILSSNASAPSGFTDKSSTYSNKFIRINSTALTEAGSDTHTHGAGSYVGGSHNHALVDKALATGTSIAAGTTYSTQLSNGDTTSNATGAVTGTSASGSSVPAYLTLKMYMKT